MPQGYPDGFCFPEGACCLPDGSFGYVGAPHNLADTGLNQECVPP